MASMTSEWLVQFEKIMRDFIFQGLLRRGNGLHVETLVQRSRDATLKPSGSNERRSVEKGSINEAEGGPEDSQSCFIGEVQTYA